MDEDYAFDYGLDWTGYDYGDSGYVEPFNYEPEGYENPAWDTEEHYSYQPPTGDNSSEVVSPGGGNYVEGIYGNTDPETSGKFNMLGQWGDYSGASKSLKDYANSGRSSGGGGRTINNPGTYRVTSTIGKNTTRRFATKDMPGFNGPSLNIPEWDNEKLKRLRQSKANSGVSSLRNAMNRAIIMARSAQTGYAARQSLRDALAGYGTGISKIMHEADTEANTEYGREYTAGASKALNEYNAKYQVANTMYQAAMQDYLNSFTTEVEQTQDNVYSYFSA